MLCDDCGGWLDMRDLGDVLRHTEPGHTAEAPQ